MIKTGSRGVCCHIARGCVRNRKSNPEGVSPKDLTYCSHKPECIVNTNHDRSVTIITWQFQFHSVNVIIIQLKYDYRARCECRCAWYSDCYFTWCLLTTRIVASQYLVKGCCARDALSHSFDIDVFKTIERNSTTIKHIHKFVMLP